MRARLHLIIIMALVCLSASAHSVAEEDGYYMMEHTWSFEGKRYSISLGISTEIYDYYQNEREHVAYRYQFKENEIPPHYYSFMLSEYDRPVAREMARLFGELASSDLEQLKLVVSFVQSLPYAFDSDSKGVDEYVRYPVETLVDGCGDCEDKVALLAAILHEMNADFLLIVLPEHMAVGVHCDGLKANRYLLFQDKKYYYVETTMPNWNIGDIPENYHQVEMEVMPVDDTPCLLIKGVRFESQPTLVFEKASCELQVDLHNLGPRNVTGLRLHVRVIEKGKRNRLLAEEYYTLHDLPEGMARTERISLKSIIKENCTLQVELTGLEVNPQYYEVELNYNRTRR